MLYRSIMYSVRRMSRPASHVMTSAQIAPRLHVENSIRDNHFLFHSLYVSPCPCLCPHLKVCRSRTHIQIASHPPNPLAPSPLPLAIIESHLQKPPNPDSSPFCPNFTAYPPKPPPPSHPSKHDIRQRSLLSRHLPR